MKKSAVETITYHYSVTQAARLLGCTRGRLQRLMLLGEIRYRVHASSKERDSEIEVLRGSFNAYVAKYIKAGRPSRHRRAA